MIRMDSKFASLLVTGLLASAFSLPALAQDPVETLDKIVLEGKTGSVMTSTGSQYESAATGKLLINGESLMLGENSKATVVYYYLDRNGDLRRKCVEKYEGANTFTIDDSCKKAAWVNDGGSAKGAGIIVAAGVIAGAIIGSGDNVPVGPLSTGPNGTIRHL